MHLSCGQHVETLIGEGEEVPLHLQLITNSDEIAYMLHQIDPFNNKLISYSEIIQMLSCYMVTSHDPIDVQSVPLLEKFVVLMNLDEAKMD